MRIKRLTATFLLVMYAVALVAEPSHVHAASTLVQQSTNLNAGMAGLTRPGISISASFPAGVTSGNVIVVAVLVMNGVYYTPAVVNSVSDSTGSSFTQAVDASYSSMHVYIYYATLSSGGPDTVTATFNVDLDDLSGASSIYIYEVSGVTTTGVATGAGFGTVSGSGTISTSSTSFENGAFLIAIMATNVLVVPGSSWEAGSSFQFSPNHPYDVNVQLAKAMYSISGVSSPTTFPATLSRPGYDPNWVEAGIALAPSDFSVSNDGGIVVTQGGSGSNTITVTLAGVATTPVALSVSGLPSGSSGSFDPKSGNPTFASKLTITTSLSTPAGSYLITVTGTGSEIHITAFTLTVNTVAGPVGGVVVATNKLVILTPYLVLVGLVIAVSAVVLVKRRRD